MRLTRAAWLLLQRLQQETAELTFCADRRCSRFHFTLRGNASDVVRDSTLDSLDRAGLLQRTRASTPRYTINDRGRQLLRERISEAEFADEMREAQAPVRQGMTVTDGSPERIG